MMVDFLPIILICAVVAVHSSTNEPLDGHELSHKLHFMQGNGTVAVLSREKRGRTRQGSSGSRSSGQSSSGSRRGSSDSGLSSASSECNESCKRRDTMGRTVRTDAEKQNKANQLINRLDCITCPPSLKVSPLECRKQYLSVYSNWKITNNFDLYNHQDLSSRSVFAAVPDEIFYKYFGTDGGTGDHRRKTASRLRDVSRMVRDCGRKKDFNDALVEKLFDEYLDFLGFSQQQMDRICDSRRRTRACLIRDIMISP